MRELLNFKYLTYIYLFILLLGTVLPINTISSSSLNDHYTLHIRWDYLLHALVYLPLPMLLALGLKKRSVGDGHSGVNITRLLIWIVLISLSITILFEGIQMILPYRAFNINDMVANGIGASIGLMVILVFRNSFFGIRL